MSFAWLYTQTQRLLSPAYAGLLSTFIYILFHKCSLGFLLFYQYIFLYFPGRGVMNCFTYTLNMRHMFLAVAALNIYMHFPVHSAAVSLSATNYFCTAAAAFKCDQVRGNYPALVGLLPDTKVSSRK